MSPQDERGSSAVELVVASALTAILLAIALPIVLTAHRASGRVLAEGRLHGDARGTLTDVVRSLRSARPPAACADPAGAPVDACLELGVRLATLLQATPHRLCFASTPNAVASELLVAPDLVCLGQVGDELLVSTRRPKAVADCEPGSPRPTTYTTPCWDHGAAGRGRVLGRVLPGSPPPFHYRDAGGRALMAPGPAVLDDVSDDDVLRSRCDPAARCAAAELAAIAVVEVDLRLGHVEGRARRELRLRLDVAPRGSVLARAQSWSAR